MKKLTKYFNILGLKPDATENELRRAYRELVRVWHPDRFGDDPQLQYKAQEKLKEINEAHRILHEAMQQTGRVEQAEEEPLQKSGQKAYSDSAESFAFLISLLTALFKWITDWPNILFLLLVAASIRFAETRYGHSFQAAAYCFELLILPAGLSFVVNSRFGNKRAMRIAYLAGMTAIAVYMVVDGMAYKRELQEATFSDESPPAGVYAPSAGQTRPSIAPFESGTVQPRERRVGPLPPDAPRSPSPPVAPAAPISPIVPPASPGR